MDNKFTWTPLYKELAKALLRYKENRTALVEWIYEDLSKVTNANGQSLVTYLKQKDGSRITDIDPFSVFAIFNRNTSWGNRTELLNHFKKKFGLASDIPTDFNGIPTVDARRSFFFSWKSDTTKSYMICGICLRTLFQITTFQRLLVKFLKMECRNTV